MSLRHRALLSNILLGAANTLMTAGIKVRGECAIWIRGNERRRRHAFAFGVFAGSIFGAAMTTLVLLASV